MPKKVNINGVGVVNFPDNFTPEQIQHAIETDILPNDQNAQPQEPEQAPLLDRLGRQAGLTGRHLIEGAADLVGVVSDPIAGLMNMAGANASSAHDVGVSVADTLGLPSPENSTERVVGDASRLLVGTGGLVKGFGAAAERVASPVAKNVLGTISSQPGYQAASSVGAGAAGGATREAGGGTGAQFGAAIAGGLTAPGMVAGVRKASDVIRNFITAPKPEAVDRAIRQAGINMGDLSASVQQSLRADVEAALRSGNGLSHEAVARLAQYKTIGATPTRGSLTLNPADITRDRNMVKMSANSSDPAAQRLSTVARDNDLALMGKLDELGAETADDAITAGAKVIDSLKTRDEQAKAIINGLYKEARATDGRSALIDPHAFTSKANNLLDESLLGGKLPADVRNKLNSIAKGETPLTVDVAEQLKTNIAGLQRASTDPAERLALGHVRAALDDAPLIDGQGEAAIKAFTKARKVNAAYMKMVESTPALKAVRDGIEPDKFVQQFIVGNGSKSNVADVAALKKAVGKNPEALQSIRDQIVSHLKNRAVNGNANEVANFSPSAYNKALNDIGDMKLSMFFTKEDLDMLKTIGKVASYEKFQPTGSAVNNSNTAAATVMALLDRIANSPLIRKFPLGGELLANPAKNISVGIGSRNSLDAAKGIAAREAAKEKPALPLSALLIPGSLASE